LISIAAIRVVEDVVGIQDSGKCESYSADAPAVQSTLRERDVTAPGAGTRVNFG